MTPRPTPLPPWRLAAGCALIVAVTVVGLVVAPRAVGWLDAGEGGRWQRTASAAGGFEVMAPGPVELRGRDHLWTFPSVTQFSTPPAAPGAAFERYAVAWVPGKILTRVFRFGDRPEAAFRPEGADPADPALRQLAKALASFEQDAGLTLERPRAVAPAAGEFTVWEAEFTARGPDPVGGAARVVAAGDRVYLLVAARRGHKPGDADARRFFDSFRLTDDQSADARREARAAQEEAQRDRQRHEANRPEDEQNPEAFRQQQAARDAEAKRQQEAFQDTFRKQQQERAAAQAQWQAAAALVQSYTQAEEANAAERKIPPFELFQRRDYIRANPHLGWAVCRLLDFADDVTKAKDRAFAATRPAAPAGLAAADYPAWQRKGLRAHLPLDATPAGRPHASAIPGGPTVMLFVTRPTPPAPGVSGEAIDFPREPAAEATLTSPWLGATPRRPAEFGAKPAPQPATLALWLKARSADGVVWSGVPHPGDTFGPKGERPAFAELALRGGKLLLGPGEPDAPPLSFDWPGDFQWHHVAVTFEPLAEGGHRVTAYRDGARTGQAETARPAVAQAWRMTLAPSRAPSFARTGPARFVGTLDELALFDKPLAAADVALLAKAAPGKARPGAP